MAIITICDPQDQDDYDAPVFYDGPEYDWEQDQRAKLQLAREVAQRKKRKEALRKQVATAAQKFLK